jgi:hypothetical protein
VASEPIVELWCRLSTTDANRRGFIQVIFLREYLRKTLLCSHKFCLRIRRCVRSLSDPSADRPGAAEWRSIRTLLGGFSLLINGALCEIRQLFIGLFFLVKCRVQERHGFLETKFLRPGL